LFNLYNAEEKNAVVGVAQREHFSAHFIRNAISQASYSAHTGGFVLYLFIGPLSLSALFSHSPVMHVLVFQFVSYLTVCYSGCHVLGSMRRAIRGSTAGRSRRGFFSKTSTPPLGPMELPIQWVPGTFNRRRFVNLTTHHCLMPLLRTSGAILIPL
jgi:hypothetical protein